jgi:holo-[acyl-carrier protein] synthase
MPGKKKTGKMPMSGMGIGVDIEAVLRFKRMTSPAKQKMLKRLFTAKELAYCFSKKNPAPHLAARFAAKEALYKALGGVNAPGFLDVEILPNKLGAPQLTVRGPSRGRVHVSLSHTETQAIAFVVVLAGKKGT